MRLFKFLAAGATGPFSGYHWPQPADGVPGRWAVADEPLEPCRRGLHLCRPRDLPLWLNEELYAVEVAGALVEGDSFVLATQARLLHHVVGWSPEAADRFSRACAWEVRDVVTAALRREGKDADTELLASSESLAALLKQAERLGRGENETWLAGYVADAAKFAGRVSTGPNWAANAATTAMVATTAARAAAEPDERESAGDRELRRQADWLLQEVVASAVR